MYIVNSNQKSEPFFTIITVVRNGANFMEDCIESVRNQTFSDFEYIVIDGGSTDGTIEIIQRNLDIVSIFLSEPDFGIYDAMNKGIRVARGKYIGIINSDDRYKTWTLETVHNEIKTVSNDCVAYGAIEYSDSKNQNYHIKHTELAVRMIYHPAVFVSSSVYLQLGAFNLKYKIAADYDFILRCFASGVEFRPIESSLAIYRKGGYSNMHQYRSLFETFKIQKSHIPRKSGLALRRLIRGLLGTTLRKMWRRRYEK